MPQIEYEFNFGDFFFLKKKHICPNCKVKKLSTIYKTDEPIEREGLLDKEFKMGKLYFSGESKVVKKPFLYCEKCNLEFSIKEIKQKER